MAHDDDVPDGQSLDAVRQDADRVVVGGLELVRDVPLCEERTRWCREDRSLRNSGITDLPQGDRYRKNREISLRKWAGIENHYEPASQEQVLRVLSVLGKVVQQAGVG